MPAGTSSLPVLFDLLHSFLAQLLLLVVGLVLDDVRLQPNRLLGGAITNPSGPAFALYWRRFSSPNDSSSARTSLTMVASTLVHDMSPTSHFESYAARIEPSGETWPPSINGAAEVLHVLLITCVQGWHQHSNTCFSCQDLRSTKVIDAGWSNIKELNNLQDLNPTNTKITGEGVAEL